MCCLQSLKVLHQFIHWFSCNRPTDRSHKFYLFCHRSATIMEFLLNFLFLHHSLVIWYFWAYQNVYLSYSSKKGLNYRESTLNKDFLQVLLTFQYTSSNITVTSYDDVFADVSTIVFVIPQREARSPYNLHKLSWNFVGR